MLVVAGLIALIYFRKGNRPATYTLAQPWTGAPILWSATDEVIPAGHPHGHEGAVLSVGGGARGGW